MKGVGFWVLAGFVALGCQPKAPSAPPLPAWEWRVMDTQLSGAAVQPALVVCEADGTGCAPAKSGLVLSGSKLLRLERGVVRFELDAATQLELAQGSELLVHDAPRTLELRTGGVVLSRESEVVDAGPLVVKLLDRSFELLERASLVARMESGNQGQLFVTRGLVKATEPTESRDFRPGQGARFQRQAPDDLRAVFSGKVSRFRQAVLANVPQPADATVATVEDGFLALRLRAELPADAPIPLFQRRDRVLVLDASQSQSLASFTVVQELALAMLRSLESDEQFAILLCDSACQAFPKAGLSAPTGDALAKAAALIAKRKPTGASDLAGALRAAAELLPVGASAQLVYLGDGAPSAGELSVPSISKRVRPSFEGRTVDLRLFGVGRRVDELILGALARELSGSYDYVESSGSLAEQTELWVSGLRMPLLVAPTLEVPETVSALLPHVLPNLRLGEELWVYGKSTASQPFNITLRGTLNGAPYALVRPVTLQISHASRPFAAKAWADAQTRELSLASDANARRAVSLLSQPSFGQEPNAGAPIGNVRIGGLVPVAGGTVGNAARRVAAMRRGFRDCYQRGLVASPEAEGSLQLLMSVGLAGQVASASLSPSGNLPLEVVNCVEAHARAGEFAAPEGGLATIAVALTFTPIDNHQPAPPPELPGYVALNLPGDQEWTREGDAALEQLQRELAASPKSRQRQEALLRGLLVHGRFTLALAAAERFVELEPELALARELLADAAVASGDRARAVSALDELSEHAGTDPWVHDRTARAFEALGDEPRACAHWRSLVELLPASDVARFEALRCRARVLNDRDAALIEAKALPQPGPLLRRVRRLLEAGPMPAYEKSNGSAGQFEATLFCEPSADCPYLIAITPTGTVLSPWTPGLGRSDATSFAFSDMLVGEYRVLLVGGRGGVEGQVEVHALNAWNSFSFAAGDASTIATTQVLPGKPRLFPF